MCMYCVCIVYVYVLYKMTITTYTIRNKLYNRKTLKKKYKSHQDTKNIFIEQNNYIPRDGETDIPINYYAPLKLPHSVSNFYKITQSETPGIFIASVVYTPRRIEILIGGSIMKHDCVHIIIRPVDFENPAGLNEALLLVSYNQLCNVSKDLKSAVILARVAVSFAYTYFRIDKFVLKDQSRIYCNNRHRQGHRQGHQGAIGLSLPAKYLLKYGKTWYQLHLNARILHPRVLHGIQRYIAFSKTKSRVFGNYLKTTKEISETNKEELQHRWEQADNYADFVGAIFDGIDKTKRDNNQCELLEPWFNIVFSKMIPDLLMEEAEQFIVRDDFRFVDGLAVASMTTSTMPSSLLSIYSNTHYYKIQHGGFNEPRWFSKIFYKRGI